ncbi:MAG: sugar kinase [Firmicutes bacterium]|nr:sugar kinase [Bacillota bacterium]
MAFDLISFGEAMLRFSPPKGQCIEQACGFDLYVAGSELNATITAQRLGLQTSFITRLTRSPLGSIIANCARAQGVDISNVVWTDGDRVGLYFFEYGSPPRPAVAYYDRQDSAFGRSSRHDYQWENILKGSKVFLTSGINLALNPTIESITLEGMQKAKELGLLVAFDLNYRSRLWSYEAAARAIRPLLRYVDILFASGDDARHILQVDGPLCEDSVLEIAARYGVNTATIIFNPNENNGPSWRIITAHKGEVYGAEQRAPVASVDRLGAGDAFAGGFIAGLFESGPELAIKMGNACMALKNTLQGDICWVTREMVMNYIDGDGAMLKR